MRSYLVYVFIVIVSVNALYSMEQSREIYDDNLFETSYPMDNFTPFSPGLYGLYGLGHLDSELRKLLTTERFMKLILELAPLNLVLKKMKKSPEYKKEIRRRLLVDSSKVDKNIVDYLVKENDYEMVMLALRYGFRLQDDTLPFDVENPDMKNLLLLSLKYQDPVLLKWMVDEDKKRREELAWIKIEVLRRWKLTNFSSLFFNSQVEAFEKRSGRIPIGVSERTLVDTFLEGTHK